MVLFDQGSRFFGADASSLQTRKPLATPAMMGVLLGREEIHPSVVDFSEKSYPVPFVFNETRNGMTLEVQKAGLYTPEELMAMVLSHAREMTSAFTSDGKPTKDPLPKDAVLTVPSFYTQNERTALLTAASLAGLNVLSLIDENTAAALRYGMDRVVPAGETKTVLFYNLGATSLQVSVVQYSSYTVKESGKNTTVGAFNVLSKAWDATCGGDAFDAVIVDYLADEFNKQWKKGDVRDVPRAMAKIRVQAKKVKEVLSANNKIPIYMEGLHDDLDFKSELSREKFEKMSSSLFDRASVPFTAALERASLSISDVDAIELIGGGMRVPKVQESLASVAGGKELGMHINSDESMALGAAFHGANISTAFEAARKVGMTDVSMFPVGVRLSTLESEAGGGLMGMFGGKKKKKDKEEGEEDEPWGKQATIFKEFGKMGIKKTIAFSHDSDVSVSVVYEESQYLPAGTGSDIVKYNVTGVEKFAAEMAKKDLGTPKVSMQFELSGSGIVKLLKAEATVEEMVEVEVEERVEDDEAGEEEEEEEEEEEKKEEEKKVEEEEKKEEEKKKDGEEKEGEENTKEEGDEAGDDAEETEKADVEDAEEEKKSKKKKKQKKYKTIKVMKEQKKVHKEVLKVSTYYTSRAAPYSESTMNESVEKLVELAKQDEIRKELEEAKNQLESKVYSIKNYVSENEEELDAVSTAEQREELVSLASATEDWLYDDGYDAGKEQFVAKLAELNAPAEAMFFRLAELTARPAAVKKCKEKVEKMRALMTKWETTMEQITEEERGDVFEKIEKVEKWLEEKLEAQAKLEKWDDVAFKSSEIPAQTKGLEQLVLRLSKKPKPKPKPVKNETDANATSTTEGGGEGEGAEDLDDKKEGDKEKVGGEGKEVPGAETGGDDTEEGKGEEKSSGGDEL